MNGFLNCFAYYISHIFHVGCIQSHANKGMIAPDGARAVRGETSGTHKTHLSSTYASKSGFGGSIIHNKLIITNQLERKEIGGRKIGTTTICVLLPPVGGFQVVRYETTRARIEVVSPGSTSCSL